MKIGGLIPDWRSAWKWFSVQGALLLTAAPEIYDQAGSMREYIPARTFHWAMLALGGLVILGRVVRQEKKV